MILGIHIVVFDHLVHLFFIRPLISGQDFPWPSQLGVDGEVADVQLVRYFIKAERAVFQRVGSAIAGADPHVVGGVACIDTTEVKEGVEVHYVVTTHAVRLDGGEDIPTTEPTDHHRFLAEVVKAVGAMPFILHVEKPAGEGAEPNLAQRAPGLVWRVKWHRANRRRPRGGGRR